MGTKRTDEFRADAVRIALTSGLTRRQVASDLGVGLSALNKWLTAHRDTDVVSDKELDLARENERLRRENRILKEEDILKGHGLLREPKAMRFRFIHCPAVETQFRREGKSMAAISRPTVFASSRMSANEVFGPIAAVRPVKGSENHRFLGRAASGDCFACIGPIRANPPAALERAARV